MAAVAPQSPAVDLPSRYRVEPGSYDIPVGTFPQTSSTTPENPDQIATAIVEKLNVALANKDSAALVSLFIENCYWRDHLCLSWDFRCLKGREAIAKYVGTSSASIKAEIDRSSPFRAPHTGPIDAFGDVHGIVFFVKVNTNFGTGNGVVRLAQQGDEWKIFTVSTLLLELNGHAEATASHRPLGVQHGARQGRQNWQDRRNAEINYEGKEPAVLIVGRFWFWTSTWPTCKRRFEIPQLTRS